MVPEVGRDERNVAGGVSSDICGIGNPIGDDVDSHVSHLIWVD